MKAQFLEPSNRSITFPNMSLKIETLNHCHALEEKGYLFHSEDTQTTEEEYLFLLHALIYCLKPSSILETGSHKGAATVSMAEALKENSGGLLCAIEVMEHLAEQSNEAVRKRGLSLYVDVITEDSIYFLSNTNSQFDFAFFDSELHLRAQELQICLDRKLLAPGSFFAMHDTSRLRITAPGQPDPKTPVFWNEFEQIKGIKWLEFPLSRGLVLGQVV